MNCTNCGFELPENVAFCTNCGAAVPVDLPSSASGDTTSEGVTPATLGASLEAAVEANKQEMDSIEARAQAQVDAAFEDFPALGADSPDDLEGLQSDTAPSRCLARARLPQV